MMLNKDTFRQHVIVNKTLICDMIRMAGCCAELRELVMVDKKHSQVRIPRYDEVVRQVVSETFRFRRVHIHVFGKDFHPLY